MSRVLPDNFISFSKLKEYICTKGYMKENLDYAPKGGSGVSDPVQRLRAGKERHEKIQNTIRGYAELTPLFCYSKKPPLFLVGHVDHYDFVDDILYEIKSYSYFKHNAQMCVLQISFYIYLMNQWFRVNGLSNRVKKACLVLYKGEKFTTLAFKPEGEKIQSNIKLMKRVLNEYINEKFYELMKISYTPES